MTEEFIDFIKQTLSPEINEDSAEIKRNMWNIQHRSIANSVIHADEIFISDENILVLLHPFSANSVKETHSHEFFEFAYVMRGQCHQTIGDTELDLIEGDLCILNPHAKHTIGTRSEDDILVNIIIKKAFFSDSFMNLIADNDMMSNFFLMSLMTLRSSNPYLYFPAKSSKKAVELIHKLIFEYCEKGLCYKKSMEFYLALICTEFLRLHKESVDQQNFELMGNNELSEILNFINQNKATVTLTSVANYFGYHPNYLSALIKQHTNQSFSVFLKHAKLEEASYRLANTDNSVDAIAEDLGYYDRSYFHKVFKSKFDITPTEYRRKYRERAEK